ncbi:MAG: ATP-dependent Clp protease proteolytic subunit [Lachnospiraceae bacterium]|nr:ATP-dependent Clp protease proteolytic subunit [Lachnospiraceae bacterium]
MENYRKNQYDSNNSCAGESAGQESDISAENPPETTEESSARSQLIYDTGEAFLNDSRTAHNIHLLTIIGEIEGHDTAGSQVKTTKYEHILPRLALIEDDVNTDGLLILLNTTGGDVDAGLSIAEMIASLSKPSVSLVLGGSHSIGVPLAVSTTWSFIVPTGTMIVHPVQMSGRVIGAPQTYEYNKRIQDRITGFIASHSRTTQKQLEKMMMENTKLTKDLGTILIGEEAVQAGLIHETGGIQDALRKLHELIEGNCSDFGLKK